MPGSRPQRLLLRDAPAAVLLLDLAAAAVALALAVALLPPPPIVLLGVCCAAFAHALTRRTAAPADPRAPLGVAASGPGQR